MILRQKQCPKTFGKQYAEHSKKHETIHIWSSNCTPEHSSKGNNSIWAKWHINKGIERKWAERKWVRHIFQLKVLTWAVIACQ